MGILNLVTTYGRGLRSTDIPGEFTLRVYTGGLAGNDDAEQRAKEEFNRVKSEHGYSTYEIVARRSRWFPSCVDFTVRFHK